MARLVGCIYGAIGFLAAQQLAPLAVVEMPTAWAYELSPTCYWSPRPWTRALGPRIPSVLPDRAGRRAEWACLKGRGLKSMVIFSAQIEQRWPSPATLAKWETEDAQREDPLPADWRYSPEPD